MEKFPLAVRNILKMIMWIMLISIFILWFGFIYGIILYVLFVFAWSIAFTLIREYLQAGDKQFGTILKAIFETSPTLPFTAYGCYCSPKYGADGRTNGLEPIDGLDADCQKHDNDMIMANEAFANGALTKTDFVKLKNRGDWNFMKRVIVSENTASGIYLISLEVGFLLRIIARSI